MLRTLIIDDEEHVREVLRTFLERYCPQVKVIGEAPGVADAYELIIRHHPDLVLLDIQMTDGTGFELMQKFDSPDFKVIFVTAHDQYAIQAFKVSAVDFILKPVSPTELAEAVSRAQQSVQQELRIRLDALESHIGKNGPHRKKIVIKTLDNIFLVELDTITHCESDGSYTRIFTTGQGDIFSSKPIKEFDDMLAGGGFFRIHRSFLINLAHIKRFDKTEGGFVILTNDHRIPVASRKREVLVNLLDELAV